MDAPRPSISQPVSPVASAPSERLVLARLAQAAALRVPGVVAIRSGSSAMYCTNDGTERVDGVACVAAPEGYDVSLRLVCAVVPLPELGQRVQAAVRSAARTAAIPLAEVSVYIAELANGAP